MDLSRAKDEGFSPGDMVVEPESLAALTTPDGTMVTYGAYLQVNRLLDLQQPLSAPAQHDEMLFIVIHQVYELWFKQLLHEIDLSYQALSNDQAMAFLRTAKRIATIQSVLTHQVDVLETMTPVDFNRFRARLNPASGFQSRQFRVLEFRLGAKNKGYMAFHRHDPQSLSALEAAIAAPTLYDAFLALLGRRGFSIPGEVLNRDVREAYTPHPQVLEAILNIYRDASAHYDLYLVLEALIDLDEGLLLWRQRHVAMVERMIGQRPGTGGSSGARYLASTLSKRFFPEIWDARNWLGDVAYGGDNGKRPGSDQG